MGELGEEELSAVYEEEDYWEEWLWNYTEYAKK